MLSLLRDFWLPIRSLHRTIRALLSLLPPSATLLQSSTIKSGAETQLQGGLWALQRWRRGSVLFCCSASSCPGHASPSKAAAVTTRQGRLGTAVGPWQRPASPGCHSRWSMSSLSPKSFVPPYGVRAHATSLPSWRCPAEKHQTRALGCPSAPSAALDGNDPLSLSHT